MSLLKRQNKNRILIRANVMRIDVDFSPIKIPFRVLELTDVYDVAANKHLFKSHRVRCGKWSEHVKIGDTIEFEAQVVSKESPKKSMYGMDCGKIYYILSPRHAKILSSRYGEN